MLLWRKSPHKGVFVLFNVNKISYHRRTTIGQATKRQLLRSAISKQNFLPFSFGYSLSINSFLIDSYFPVNEENSLSIAHLFIRMILWTSEINKYLPDLIKNDIISTNSDKILIVQDLFSYCWSFNNFVSLTRWKTW